MKKLALTMGVIILASCCLAEFPTVTQQDIETNDNRLKGPIDKSKQGELTIGSINVRNLGARKRCLKDFRCSQA